MGLKSPNRSIPIPNILFNRPFVNDSGKITLLERLLWITRTWKQIGPISAEPTANLLLLGLNGSHHLLIYQRNDMFLFGFPLVQSQIPFMLVIANEAGRRESAYLADSQTTFEKNHHHAQNRGW